MSFISAMKTNYVYGYLLMTTYYKSLATAIWKSLRI
jgi:hypothetical protein